MFYKNKNFQQAQIITLLLCTTGYTVSYLCRTNLSISLYHIISEFNITASAAGLIGTLFFWSYAVGQLLSGWINTFVSSKILFTLGLITSAITNIMIAYSNSYGIIVLMWLLNGFGLAFLWTPLISIISNWFRPHEFSRITLFLSLPTTVGYIISWGLLDPLIKIYGWRIAFTCPAVIAIIFVVIWVASLKVSPKLLGFEDTITPIVIDNNKKIEEATISQNEKTPLKKIFLSSTMIVFIILLISFGCIKEGVGFWAPSLISEGLGNDGLLPVLLIPIFSTIGLLASTYLTRKLHDNLDGVFIVLLVFGAVSGVTLALFSSRLWIPIMSLSTLMAVLCGATSILTTLVPLRFAHTGHGTKITGILNFTAYLGAALGGIASGAISDSFGWNGVYIFWAVIMVMALVVFISATALKKHYEL